MTKQKRAPIQLDVYVTLNEKQMEKISEWLDDITDALRKGEVEL